MQVSTDVHMVLFLYKRTLRKLVMDHQDDWDDHIDTALFTMRTKPQSSTKYSPFFLLYGRDARYPSQLPKGFGESVSVHNELCSVTSQYISLIIISKYIFCDIKNICHTLTCSGESKEPLCCCR